MSTTNISILNCFFPLKKKDIPDIKVSHALNNQFDASGKRHLRGAMETTKECTCDKLRVCPNFSRFSLPVRRRRRESVAAPHHGHHMHTLPAC